MKPALGQGGVKRPKRVLAIMLELDKWQAARTWSYLGSYALLDGFEACDIEWTMLPSLLSYPDTRSNPWVEARESLLGGETFDQVWVWLTHAHYQADFWPWLEKIAPVRVGVLMESLRYTAEEIASYPDYARRFDETARQMRYLTHAISYDEQDVAELAQVTGRPTRLYFCMIPALLVRTPPAGRTGKVLFLGSLYEKRKAFLEEAGIGERMEILASPEEANGLDIEFDVAHREALDALTQGRMTKDAMHAFGLRLRTMRRAMLEKVLDIYSGGIAVLNLPSYFKGFPSRVVEAQAAGAPVLTNRLENRPQTMAAYTHLKDIIYYDADNAGDLAHQIDALVQDPALRGTIGVNARNRVIETMTSEVQMPILQAWIKRTSPSGLQRLLRQIWPQAIEPATIPAIRNGQAVTRLDKRRGLKVQTGSWTRRTVGGVGPLRITENDRNLIQAPMPYPWALGLAAPVGDLLAGKANWLVVELFDLGAPITLSLVDLATGAATEQFITPEGPDSLEIWLRCDRRADTLAIQAGQRTVGPVKVGRLRAVCDPSSVATAAFTQLNPDAADALARDLQAYRNGERQMPMQGGRQALLRDDGLSTRLTSSPYVPIAMSLTPDALHVQPGSSIVSNGAWLVIDVGPNGAPWSYFAAIDVAANLPPGRQTLALELDVSGGGFGIGILSKDQSCFIQRWMAPVGVAMLEVWFDIVDPTDVSTLVLQHWDEPFQGQVTLKGLWRVRSDGAAH